MIDPMIFCRSPGMKKTCCDAKVCRNRNRAHSATGNGEARHFSMPGFHLAVDLSSFLDSSMRAWDNAADALTFPAVAGQSAFFAAPVFSATRRHST
jgi:hypothetical protein